MKKLILLTFVFLGTVDSCKVMAMNDEGEEVQESRAARGRRLRAFLWKQTVNPYIPGTALWHLREDENFTPSFHAASNSEPPSPSEQSQVSHN
jgi:hypothetical protein